MKFTKMHGCGNDYIYVNCMEESICDRSLAAFRLSDRHFGIGADGLICIDASDVADFKMDMYNADGSQGKMCGNGIRCVGKYVYDHGLTDKTTVRIATGSGVKILTLETEDGKVKNVQFLGGCNGNLKGIGALVEGMDVNDVIARVEGIHCGPKSTSCPDQLAQALKEVR